MVFVFLKKKGIVSKYPYNGTLKAYIKSSGRERGIRTPGDSRHTGFQDRHVQPLRHLPTIKKEILSRLDKSLMITGGTSRTRTGEWQLCRLQPYQLGDSSIICRWYPEPDLNRHGRNDRGILSPLCLPFHHPGSYGYQQCKSSSSQQNQVTNTIALLR